MTFRKGILMSCILLLALLLAAPAIAGDASVTIRGEILPSSPVVANFSGTPATGDAPLEVRFTDQSSGNPVQWRWEFGDGRIATTKNPIITYWKPGTYTVRLTVTNSDGLSDTKTGSIIVTRPNPVANFTADTTRGYAPVAVQFTDTSTWGPDTYAWEFGDGGTSSDPDPEHIYTTAGTYTVRLSVSRDGGPISTATEQITVKPVAGFTADATRGYAPFTVQFTGTSTGDPDTYAWEFGDGGTSSDPDPEHTYTTPGTYQVSLRVSGGGQTHTETKATYITVVDPGAPPAAEFRTDTTRGYAPVTVQFFDQSQGDVDAWLWEFGDGGTSSDPDPEHTYTTPGTYTVRLTAKEGARSNTITKIAYIIVDDPRPVAAFTASKMRGEAPFMVQFTESSSGAPPLTRTWDFGDGESSGLRNPVHVFDSAGEGAKTYTVRLTTTNAFGSNSTTTRITVVSPPQKEDVSDRINQSDAKAKEKIPLTYQGLALEIPEECEAKHDEKPIMNLSVGVAPDLVEPSVGTIEVGEKAFELGPRGATFNPEIPVTITFTVDEWARLFGDGKTTKIQRYDGKKWIELLHQTRDDTNRTLTGYTDAFSVFAPVTTTTGSSPTTEPTTTQRSSGSGGGGSQASVGAASNLKAGDRVALSMDRTAISTVAFTAKNPIRDVMVTVAKGSLPRDVRPPTGTVYQYIQTILYRAAEDDLSNVWFRFAVPTDWLAAQGCTENEVGIFRLTDDGWREVPVEVLGEENGNAIFVTSPEGFSLFAITATGKAPDVEEPTLEPIESETTPPADVTTTPIDTTPTTPQPTPLPVWTALMALGVSLLLVRRRT